MTERAKFEKWLSDLEAKRSTTPEHVFDRVKADYSLRLDGVLDKLREHTSAMREHAENLTRRLQELADAEQNLRDERAEHELRADVGELSEAEWDTFSKKTERTLAKLQEDQAAISSDLERMRELLSSVDGTPKAAPSPAPAAKGMDEMEFLKSVVGTTPHGAPASQAATAEARGGGVPAAAGPPADAPPKAEPGASASATPKGAAAASAASPTPPASQPAVGKKTPASGSSLLRNTGQQDVPKTLKCAECGSMNYPSEWYCERCGAELANI